MVSGRTVLLVDDSPAELALARMLLEPEFEVSAASSASDALALARDLVPDVILSDVVMQPMSGIDLAFAVRADPDLADVKLVAVTAHYSGFASQAELIA